MRKIPDSQRPTRQDANGLASISNRIIDAYNDVVSMFANDPANTAGLYFGYLGGIVAGVVVPDGILTLDNSTTYYIEVDTAGTVSKNTVGFTAGSYPLYKVVTVVGTIDSIVDYRSWLSPNLLAMATEIHAATAKTPPIDADEFGFWDSVSGLLRKLTWANIKTTLANTFIALDQTTPQTIANGVPLMTTAVNGSGSQNQISNKAYVDLAASVVHLSEYFSASALSPAVGAFLSMATEASSAGTVQSVDITGTIGSPTAIFKWMTPAGKPNLDRIPAGAFGIHAHLLKTTTAPNSKLVAIYAEIWQNNASGVHTAKIATSATYQGFTTLNTFYDMYATVANEFPLAVTDRISIEFFGYVLSGSGENKLTMTVGGTSDSRIDIGVNAKGLSNLFAKVDLSNVASTAVNADINPDANDTWSLGTLLKAWLNLFVDKTYTNVIAPHADSTTAVQVMKADGATPVATVDTTNSRVGVGTTSPGKDLEVAGIGGTMRIRDTSVSGGTYWDLTASAGSGGFSILRNGTQLMRIRSNGNINFGTSFTPFSRFHVQKSGSIDYFGITDTVDGDVMVIKNNGNIGYGTPSPLGRVHFPAGTASIAPVILSSGVDLTVPVAGALEWNGTDLKITDSGAVRRVIVQNKMTALGDILHGGSSGAVTRLAGNTTTTKKFLRQTGDGSNSAAPAWDTVTATDVGLGSVTNDAQIAKSIGTTKGDVIAFTASATPARVGVGTDGQVLTADTASTAGVKWTSPIGGGRDEAHFEWHLSAGPGTTPANVPITTIADGERLFITYSIFAKDTVTNGFKGSFLNTASSAVLRTGTSVVYSQAIPLVTSDGSYGLQFNFASAAAISLWSYSTNPNNPVIYDIYWEIRRSSVVP